MPPLLFTSIPPRQEGRDFAATGLAAPQLETIRSWIEAGFQPVSIHMAGEIDRHPHLPEALLATAVDCEVVDAVAGESPSTPLCPIIDLLQAIHARANETPFAIINADIRLNGFGHDGPVALMQRLAEEEFLIGQRTMSDLVVTAASTRRCFPTDSTSWPCMVAGSAQCSIFYRRRWRLVAPGGTTTSLWRSSPAASAPASSTRDGCATTSTTIGGTGVITVRSASPPGAASKRPRSASMTV